MDGRRERKQEGVREEGRREGEKEGGEKEGGKGWKRGKGREEKRKGGREKTIEGVKTVRRGGCKEGNTAAHR